MSVNENNNNKINKYRNIHIIQINIIEFLLNLLSLFKILVRKLFNHLDSRLKTLPFVSIITFSFSGKNFVWWPDDSAFNQATKRSVTKLPSGAS